MISETKRSKMTGAEKLSSSSHPGFDGGDAQVISDQLERVLASQQFINTTRLNKFLRYIVEESLAGRDDNLKGYSIGVDVFDRDEGFDPQIDTIVRVQAVKLRQRLDLYYSDEGKKDRLRILVPKGAYTPVFDKCLGVEEAEMTARNGGDDLATKMPVGPSIAVLPFNNWSGDVADDYFSDGVTEEIINALTRFRELRVAARNTSFQFKGQAVDVCEVGVKLGVDYVLEGSVRKSGANIRISTQLIDAKSGMHLFAENIDRELTPENLFEIQDEIAGQVAAEIADPHGILSRVYDPQSKFKQTDNLAAYEAVLMAFEYWRVPTPERHLVVRDALEKAVTIDPSYSSAWAMLGVAYVDEYRGYYNLREDPPPLDRLLDVASMAVQIDPLNSMGYFALFIAHFHRGEMARFLEAVEKALTLNPNHPVIVAEAGICLSFIGDWDRGLRLMTKAITLSNLFPGWYHAPFIVNHYRLGEYEQALPLARKLDLDAFFWGPACEAMIFGQLGDKTGGDRAVATLLELYPEFGMNAREECRKWNFPEDLIDQFVDGWRRAGLEVNQSQIISN